MTTTEASVVPQQRRAPAPKPPPSCCWKCGQPGATGQSRLGGAPNSPGAPIPECGLGTGCQDGRVFHGPTGPAPHLPGEPCEECGTAGGRVVAPRRDRVSQLPLDACPGGDQ